MDDLAWRRVCGDLARLESQVIEATRWRGVPPARVRHALAVALAAAARAIEPDLDSNTMLP